MGGGPVRAPGHVEYRTAVEDYMAAEVLPYVQDAWVDCDKTKIGYEIPLTRHFYKYVATATAGTRSTPRSRRWRRRFRTLLGEVTE